jgi:hypothetical protein
LGDLKLSSSIDLAALAAVVDAALTAVFVDAAFAAVFVDAALAALDLGHLGAGNPDLHCAQESVSHLTLEPIGAGDQGRQFVELDKCSVAWFESAVDCLPIRVSALNPT